VSWEIRIVEIGDDIVVYVYSAANDLVTVLKAHSVWLLRRMRVSERVVE